MIWKSYFKEDPWYQNHHQTHLSFIKKINELQSQAGTKSLDETLADILGFLTQWLAYHILDTDKRMAKAVQGLENGHTLDSAKAQANLEMSVAMKTLIDTVLNMYDSLSTRTIELLREKSERIRAETALKASEQRWQFLLDQSGDELWDWNITNDEVYKSSGSVNFLDLISNKTDKQNTAIIHPDDLTRFDEGLQAHLDGNTTLFTNEHRVINSDKSWSWMFTRGKVIQRDDQGSALHMIGTHTNITDREMALIVFNNSHEGMLITDRDNLIISVNPAYTKITGYTAEELIGKDPKVLSSGKQDKAFYQNMWEQLNHMGHWSGEIWNRHKTGELFLEWLSINSIYEPNGAIHYRIAIFSDITNQKHNESLIWQQANFDALTGLPNRNMLMERIHQQLQKNQLSGLSMALLIVDLDRFREINNVHGHVAGDFVIKVIAQRLQSCVRDIDTVARMGGGEFAIILNNLDEIGLADRVAQSVLDSLTAPLYLEKETIYQSASIGITVSPADGADAATLIKNAEQSMYKSKHEGRNRYCYFTKLIQDEAQVRALFTHNLYKAIQADQFVIHYQPILELTTGAIHKAEALIRWQHPELGMISPGSFIPIAEETGLIVDIGNWVFYTTTQQLKKWRKTFDVDFQISINSSPVQFYNEIKHDSHHAWFKHMDKLGLPSNSITIEVTEGLMLKNNQSVSDQLNEFRENGFQLSLDDFGTGYSSLSYLHKYHFDYIKIDQSFVRDMTETSSQLVLCEAIIVMAHKLGLKVIAEGIETAEQRDLLIKAGCDYGQGYYLSYPIPIDEFELLLAKNNQSSNKATH